jgi:hypothetical protein
LLDQEIPDGKEAYVFTPNRLNRFQAERPEIVTKVKWNTYTPKDSTASWIESAWFTGDSIRAIITQTEPKGSLYLINSCATPNIQIVQYRNPFKVGRSRQYACGQPCV